jgi:integrase
MLDVLARVARWGFFRGKSPDVSGLVMAGVDIRTVAQLMGHSTIQMTMRCSHLAAEHNAAAVDRLVSSQQLVTKSVTGTKRGRR